MKIEVSMFIAGQVIKDIVYVERFQDCDAAAKARMPFGRIVNRKILMK